MTLKVGDRVRLTGEFLRNTGQVTGGEGKSRWIVKGFHRDWAIVDQPMSEGWFTDEELAADPMLKWRRINVGNLEVVKGR